MCVTGELTCVLASVSGVMWYRVDPQMFLDNSQFAWSYVWRVFPSVEQFEVDKQVRICLCVRVWTVVANLTPPPVSPYGYDSVYTAIDQST